MKAVKQHKICQNVLHGNDVSKKGFPFAYNRDDNPSLRRFTASLRSSMEFA